MTDRSAVIFGAEGFIGEYLLSHLQRQRIATTAASLTAIPAGRRVAGARYFTPCDVTDERRVRAVITRVRPDFVYHLAAISLPTISWKQPWRTLEVNVRGTLNILESVRRLGIDSR
ncbi:MAG: NAD-dependent epimerase/dehydratase family protein, partial [Thermoplasmata archaeon]